MKGSLHTEELMLEVVNSNTGLRTERPISHVFMMEVSTYPKMLMITDAAINIYPTLDDKLQIVQNAIELAHALGIPQSKVAILWRWKWLIQRYSPPLKPPRYAKWQNGTESRVLSWTGH
jgi:phosphotransacetylase